MSKGNKVQVYVIRDFGFSQEARVSILPGKHLWETDKYWVVQEVHCGELRINGKLFDNEKDYLFLEPGIIELETEEQVKFSGHSCSTKENTPWLPRKHAILADGTII